MPITVKTPVFEGPLEVLLDLIESRKLLINDIALATVTDEYIARLEAMEHLPLGEASEFISLAATLLLIKSRSLLPTLQLAPEETQNIKELERRLAEYQIIRTASRTLEQTFKNSPALWEGSIPQPEPIFAPDTHTTPADVVAAARRMILEFPKAVATLPKIAVKKAISLEETISHLAERISDAMRLSFREFSGHRRGSQHSREQKYTIVVSFLALLELVKQGIIRAEQGSEFGDITLEKDSVSVPSYGTNN